MDKKQLDTSPGAKALKEWNLYPYHWGQTSIWDRGSTAPLFRAAFRVFFGNSLSDCMDEKEKPADVNNRGRKSWNVQTPE